MAGPALPARRIQHMEIELVVICIKCEEEIENFLQRFSRPGILAVDLIDYDDRLETELQCFRKHEFGLRHHGFRGVYEQHDTIDHGENALDLAAEIRMARRIYDIDPHTSPFDAGAFGKNGDPTFALQIVGIERTLSHHLIVTHGA